MVFRLGYVAMTLNLMDCSPSGTVTVSALNRLPDREAKLYRLRKITRRNLENTLRILKLNKAYNIAVYRLTSKLVPLATHPDTAEWDYAGEFRDEFKEIGDFIKENNFRVSAHPDHFTLLNSPSAKVIKDAVRDLDYHVRVYEAMGLDDFKYKLVLHVGGSYGKKAEAAERFGENFIRLPARISKRIILENDDKIFSASEVLKICKDLSIPMVFDVHHHKCVNGGESIKCLLPEIFDTWKGQYFKPKIHYSSPKSLKNFRSHADNIDADGFIGFLEEAKKVKQDFDVMLEAKNKDSALLKLSEEIGRVEWIERINEGTFRCYS